jgi:hypothetical protein
MAAWAEHQPECRGLASLRRTYVRAKGLEGMADSVIGLDWVPGEAVRALARLVVRRKKERKGGTDGLWVRRLLQLFVAKSNVELTYVYFFISGAKLLLFSPIDPRCPRRRPLSLVCLLPLLSSPSLSVSTSVTASRPRPQPHHHRPRRALLRKSLQPI